MAIAWIDEVIAAKTRHAAKAERRRGSTTASDARRDLRTE
jgi:hypothetical protein